MSKKHPKTANYSDPSVLALLGLLAAFLSGGCLANGADPYSKVASVCMTQDSQMGQYISSDASVLAKTYLDPKCKAALESVIPFDDASFATAPTGLKDKVTEAFQAIIAYPLDVSMDGKFLGVSPAIAGAIPLDFYVIYQQSSNPNQALFNFILNKVDAYTFSSAGNSGESARYVPALTDDGPREVKIFLPFWDPTDPTEVYRSPFVRAAVLAHESYHGTGILHEDCNFSVTQNTGYACDAEMHGPYAFGATYLKWLIHGSAVCSTPGCVPPLPATNVMLAGYEMCGIGKYRLNDPFAELQQFLSSVNCENDVTAEWVMGREGLDALPPAAIVPGIPTLLTHGPGTIKSVCTTH